MLISMRATEGSEKKPIPTGSGVGWLGLDLQERPACKRASEQWVELECVVKGTREKIPHAGTQ